MPVNIYLNTAGGGEQIRVAWLGDDEWSLPAQGGATSCHSDSQVSR